MISKRERKKLKKIIGNHYAKEVAELLAEEGFRNKAGRPYSPASVRMVFNGFRENEVIELAIRYLAESKKQERKKLMPRR